MDFQISKHELQPVFIGSNTSQAQKTMCPMPLYLAFIFSMTKKVRFSMREAAWDTCDENMRHMMLHLLNLFLLNCISAKKLGSVAGRSFLQANTVLPFC